VTSKIRGESKLEALQANGVVESPTSRRTFLKTPDRADAEHQASVVGEQFAARVGFFLRVDDFDRGIGVGSGGFTRRRAAPNGQESERLEAFQDSRIALERQTT
jgi:hypothetical protein